jgi:hypothetical protein
MPDKQRLPAQREALTMSIPTPVAASGPLAKRLATRRRAKVDLKQQCTLAARRLSGNADFSFFHLQN